MLSRVKYVFFNFVDVFNIFGFFFWKFSFNLYYMSRLFFEDNNKLFDFELSMC